MTVLNDVHAWFRTSQPGESFVYHVGSLARQRRRGNDLHAAAEFLFGHAISGNVCLVQNHIDEESAEYIAVRRDKQPEAW